MNVDTLTAHLRCTLPGARLQDSALPLVPELRLWLLHEAFDRGPLPHEVAAAVSADPAYWAFCWASGQALARWILDHPQRVAGRTVLDFGAGSGIAGIAAARAGARRVIACDIDAGARLACAVNARHNGVHLEICDDLDAVPACDLVLVADVLYDPANRPLMDALRARFADLLLADSRVRPESLADWSLFDEVDADTLPDLDESPMNRRVRFYEPLPGQDAASRH
ncbi:MAG TPA: 50S ribosomal protein L11 methyltransferase [Pseudomonadales bacterium]|nr:50S ribosomal protein L11 methyltransferase [Pseudomonadales bacterium]